LVLMGSRPSKALNPWQYVPFVTNVHNMVHQINLVV
jgi:hypothetical protein